MIVQSALPLVAEHGTAVTTLQVARAAGIGEATIFRAFPDKDALIDACIVEALRADRVLDELGAIPLDQPLPERLVEAADTLLAHLHRLGAVLGALSASGRPRRGDREPGARPGGPDRAESMAAIRDAIAELLAPEADRLRQPAERLADAFLGYLFVRGHHPTEPPMNSQEFVDLFLRGALTADAH